MKNTLIPNRQSLALVFCLFALICFGQTSQEEEKKSPPDIKTNRAEEDYSYLKDAKSNPYQSTFGDNLKYIALNANRTTYLTLGGGYRARVEHFTNKDWTTTDETYYSQRLSFHTGLNIGKHVRFFGELYHGYVTNGPQIFQSDDIGFHQGFVALKYPWKETHELSLTFGRQELSLGANRLIGIREGTNMRRSFDMGKVIYESKIGKFQGFYGKEVNPQFGAFDNAFTLFKSDVSNPEIWGVYLEIPITYLFLTNELYYIGFRSPAAGFSDVFGEETRHTIGLRRVGTVGKHITFNTEIIYQFGKLGNSDISAFNIETDWKYIFTDTKWRPIIGLKLELSSGDRDLGDERLQTFNPLFVNPAIYSLAAVNTPANLTNIHPSITFFPAKGVSIFIDYAWFFRSSEEDGLYAPPRFQTREANGISDRHIGDALGIIVTYEYNRNISMNLMSSYFIPADYIEASGPSESIFFIAPTVTFLF